MKLIIPAAGYGSRLWPLSRAVPKELLPLGKHPALDYIIADALLAGITEIIIVISKEKESIKNYFVDFVPNNTKFDFLNHLKANCKLSFIYQEPNGLGDAILCALNSSSFAEKELVAISLPDEILFVEDEIESLAQIINLDKPIVMVQKTVPEKLHLYGIIKHNKNNIEYVIEKPDLDKAPSDLAIIGRYVLPALELKKILEQVNFIDGELSLTPALNLLAQQNNLYKYNFEGMRFDTGSYEGWFSAHDYLKNFVFPTF